MKKIFSVILSLIILLAAAGCSSPISGDNEFSTTVENNKKAVNLEEKTTYSKQNDEFTIKIYTDMNSKTYKSLDNPKISFLTGIDNTDNDGFIRFVCDKDDVKVTLVKLSYNDFRGEFNESDTVFKIKTNKGFVYEFKGYLGETMPPAKLKAEKGNYGAEFLLQMNGMDSNSDFTLKSSPFNS